jgi:3-dehydroquinate synthase
LTADPALSRRIDVALGERAYPILIESGLLARPQRWRAHVRGRHALVVTNPTVGALYAAALVDGLAGHATDVVEIPDGEEHKTLAQAERIFAALARLKASRDATVVALGGGVIGDLAGFAAACWMRGVPCVQVPTSLLAMVDSSVGGKTAVNLPEGKNLVGAFHQPSAVLIDPATLATLPARELACGLAEVVKYGAIRDAFLDRLAGATRALLARDAAALTDAIATSCRHKAEVVARDERETGERALLNFGHTFAHAIETETGYGTVKHGEAVAIGMVLAARLSERLGLAERADTERLRALLAALGLPVALPAGLAPQRLLEHMRLDKKAASGALRLILWRGVGRAEIVEGVADRDILAVLEAAYAEASVAPP